MRLSKLLKEQKNKQPQWHTKETTSATKQKEKQICKSTYKSKLKFSIYKEKKTENFGEIM